MSATGRKAIPSLPSDDMSRDTKTKLITQCIINGGVCGLGVGVTWEKQD
jgi:hypothetical protein